MKELSDLVKIEVLKKSNGVEDDPVEFTVSAHHDVMFSESPKRSISGVLYQQSLRLTLTDGQAARVPQLPVLVKAIVTLSDCDRSYVWGDREIPVEIIFTPRLNVVELDFSRNSTRPLFAG